MSSTTSLDVIFQDDSILVIDKPTGLVVNISKTSPQGTVQNILEDMVKVDPGDSSEFAKRCGIVHRIDKDTSGILVVAKDPQSFDYLKKQFMRRTVMKEYLSVVLGRVEEPIFEVNAPIARNPNNRFKMAIVKSGRAACTKFELEKSITLGNQELTLIRCYPETGRTHQIRVHLAALQHPVVGDEIYMSKKQLLLTRNMFGRLMLHAWKIQFKHPKLKEELFFESSLPKEFKKFIQNTTKN